VFVRLGGCNLRCEWCDTVFEGSDWRPSIDELADHVDELSGAWGSEGTLVVLTGGEPLRQEVGPFVTALVDRCYTVQIETSGSVWPKLGVPEAAQIVVSPKTPKVRREVRERATAWKYVVEAGAVLDDGLPAYKSGRGIPEDETEHMASTMFGCPPRPVARPPEDAEVYVQPCDPASGSADEAKANTDEAVRSAMVHGYRLSLQIHKKAGLR
jgi:organic radical activating enzyme